MLSVIVGSNYTANGQHAAKMNDRINLIHISNDFAVSDMDNKNWDLTEPTKISTYWSGKTAPESRRFTARLLWSDKAIYIRFDSTQAEPLVISDLPELNKKTLNLWDRDVCEIFIAPEASESNKYFEFEVAPTGEWIDLAIHVQAGTRSTDWEYASGMTAAARMQKNKVVSAIRVEWRALGKIPQAGDKWRGNLFRCVGKDPDRGYLAWQPTLTTDPSFHAPEKFGWFNFR